MKIKPLLFFLFLKFTFFNYSFSQEVSESGIYIMSVDFGTRTIYSISCEKFTTSFAGRMKLRLINNEDSLKILDSFLEKIKYKRKKDGVDVRAKINYIKPDDTRISICTNGYDVMVNGRLIKHNAKFVDFLKSMIFKL